MRMHVIGDSVLWGQGLAPGEKIGPLTRKELAESGWHFDYDDEADFLAHSGAIIGEPGLTGEEAHPSVPREIAGEIPTAHPTIYQQLDRIERPDEVDLLLMDGGANDFGFLNLAKPWASTASLEQSIRSSLAGAHQSIRRARQTCPNAVILYSGYYAGVSDDSSSRVLDVITTLGAMLSPAAWIANLAFGSVKDRIIRANHFWHHVQLLTLRAAVAESASDPDVRGPGIAFVHPRFGTHHAIGASGQALVRGVVTDLNPDSVLQERRGACAIHHNPPGAVIEAVTQAQTNLTRAETDPTLATAAFIWQVAGALVGSGAAFFTCANAASLHPMPAGAERYAGAFASTYDRMARVSVREFATALAPKTGSVRTAIKRWGLDGPRAPSLHRPSSLSLRELSQHREVDMLLVDIETGGLRLGTDPLPNHPLGSSFASVEFSTGARAFRLGSGGQRHLPSSGRFLRAGDRVRFVVDPSFSVERNRGEGSPMRLEHIQRLRVQAPLMAQAPPGVNWALAGIRVLLNSSIVVYDTTGDPSVGAALDRDKPGWISGQDGTPAYPAPE